MPRRWTKVVQRLFGVLAAWMRWVDDVAGNRQHENRRSDRDNQRGAYDERDSENVNVVDRGPKRGCGEDAGE